MALEGRLSFELVEGGRATHVEQRKGVEVGKHRVCTGNWNGGWEESELLK